MKDEQYDLVEEIVSVVVHKLDIANQIRMDIEDAKQTGWIAALEVLAEEREHKNLRSYLYQVVRGAILNTDKHEWSMGITASRYSKPEIESIDFEESYDETEDDTDMDKQEILGEVEEKTPLDYAIEAELLEFATRTLNSKELMVLNHLYLQGQSVREAAISLSLTRMDVQRTHEGLLDKLREVYSDNL